MVNDTISGRLPRGVLPFLASVYEALRYLGASFCHIFGPAKRLVVDDLVFYLLVRLLLRSGGRGYTKFIHGPLRASRIVSINSKPTRGFL